MTTTRKPVRTLPAPTEAYVAAPTAREVQRARFIKKPVSLAAVTLNPTDLDLADNYYGYMARKIFGA